MSERLTIDFAERVERQFIDDDKAFRDFVIRRIPSHDR
jgi:hypothetical protein